MISSDGPKDLAEEHSVTAPPPVETSGCEFRVYPGSIWPHTKALLRVRSRDRVQLAFLCPGCRADRQNSGFRFRCRSRRGRCGCFGSRGGKCAVGHGRALPRGTVAPGLRGRIRRSETKANVTAFGRPFRKALSLGLKIRSCLWPSWRLHPQ